MNTECCNWVVIPDYRIIEDCYHLIPNKKAAVAHLNLCIYGPECGECQESLDILWEEENEG